jgi:NAD(P)H-dependent flavin oxidoreductase YrpB (nitropropane dioxygenase family)
LATYWVGQGVGLVEQVRPCARIVQDFCEEFAQAFETLAAFVHRDG